jgi:hypothetical protein
MRAGQSGVGERICLKRNHNKRKEFAMSNLTLQQNAVSQLAAQADALGKLAEDTGAFAATFAAFESNDPDAFRWVLQRLELLPRCELICEWIRVKLCGLRCVEVCGPLDPKTVLPELPEFARALGQLASNEPVLRRVVDAVSCGDAESYQAAIADVKLQRFCHLICRYVCSAIYRRICEVVCTGLLVPVSNPVLDIRADAEVFSKVFENKDLSGAIGKAAIALDCDLLRKEIERAGFLQHCERICRVSCVWRSVWVCRALCLEPPVIFRGTYAVEEARNFALAARQLAGQPRALSDLAGAVISNNAQSFSAIVDRYRLGPYCWQVCGWVASEVCYWYCVCVCPPVSQLDWTNIGNFGVQLDINAAGKTKYAKLGAGGLDYAFFGALNLIGHCPENSSMFGGGQMMYRFTYSDSSVTDQPILDGNLRAIQVGGDKVSNWPTMDGAGNASLPLMPPTTDRHFYVLNRSFIANMPFPPPPPPPANSPWAPLPPALGAKWYAPAVYIWPDSNGWVKVFPGGGEVQTFMSFDTTTVVAPADPNPTFPPAPIGGIPVPVTSQLNGTDLTLTFQATRIGHTSPPDFTQLPRTLIRVNNAHELNQLTLAQFADGGCCTPITSQCTVLFSVDHEEIGSGDWSLSILSQAGFSPCETSGTTCSPSAPGNITPSFASPNRGGSGSVIQDTSGWDPCSYQVVLCTTPRLTDGLNNRGTEPKLVTFCICGH